MKEKVVKDKAVDKPIKKPFFMENETIHRDGHTQVRLWLTKEQSKGLFVFHDAIGIDYHILVQIAITEYIDSHLNESEKEEVKRILRTPRHFPTVGSKI